MGGINRQMVHTNNDKLLSIIIPVYNRQQSFNLLLADLSKSIINNKLERHIEIIVVDDASTDQTILPDEFPCKIVLKCNQQNYGAPYSREKGLQYSHGKFIHFHDSDDSISENWLSELVNELSTKPDIDLLVTGRIDFEHRGKINKYSKFFHKQFLQPKIVLTRLFYWNCIGPIGGVTFSRRVLLSIKIRKMASCQDWQMYIDAIKNAKVLSSRADIQFLFHKTGSDRISHNARKKILGHLQLSRQTEKDSPFGRNIRLFYLQACKPHVYNQGGAILRFYQKHRVKIIATFLLVAAYSFMPRFKNSNGN